jgi:hypothetical protein
MTHLSMDTLVSLREQLNQCAHCQAELQRLHQRVARLKALPTLRPGRDRWPETKARFKADRRRRRTRVVGLSGLALAASVAVAIAVGDLSRPADATAEQLNQAMERSQVLESALSEYNPAGRVLDGRTARIAGELEDRIARVDRELEVTELLRKQATTDHDLLKLWRERNGLLDALVDVHVTRASNAGL